jgi:hypothetical protein
MAVDMVRVYRVETEDNIGAYKCPCIDWGMYIHRPRPCDDGLAGFEGQHFGFRSLNAVYDWFDTEADRAALHEDGYRVSVYLVPSSAVRYGKRQLTFLLRLAKLVDTVPLEVNIDFGRKYG